MLHILLNPLILIYPHSGCYSFAAPILRIKECPTMFSHAQTSRSHKSKNLRGHDEDSGEVTLTPRHLSKPQSLKTLSAPARQSREPTSSSDRDELQEPTPQRTPIELSVQPERETDDEYENGADDDFRPFSQQPSQPAHHCLQ